MTFKQIWDQLLRKSPKLSNDQAEVTFKSDNLKALLKQVYDQGKKSAGEKKPVRDPFEGLFR
jgi:hypothetical protein